MRDLPTAEHEGDLDLVALSQEAAGVARLRLEVVILDPGAVLDLLEMDHVLLLLCLAGHLGLLELELPVVHDANNGRPRHRRHFDQIQTLLLCGRQRGIEIQNSHLTSICRNDAERADADLTIDADALRVVLNKPCSSRENAAVGPSVDSGQKKCGPPGSPLAASLTQRWRASRTPVALVGRRPGRGQRVRAASLYLPHCGDES